MHKNNYSSERALSTFELNSYILGSYCNFVIWTAISVNKAVVNFFWLDLHEKNI